jgi:hypothetical protein
MGAFLHFQQSLPLAAAPADQLLTAHLVVPVAVPVVVAAAEMAEVQEILHPCRHLKVILEHLAPAAHLEEAAVVVLAHQEILIQHH